MNTCEWVMSYKWRHVNESCHMNEHMWMSHVNRSRDKHKTWMSHVTHMNEHMWMRHVCDRTYSCEKYNTSIGETWHICVTWLIHMICVTWHIHLCHVTHWYSCVSHDIHVCDVTHSYVWHDSFMCVMTHAHVWNDSCTCFHSHVWHD